MWLWKGIPSENRLPFSIVDNEYDKRLSQTESFYPVLSRHWINFSTQLPKLIIKSSPTR